MSKSGDIYTVHEKADAREPSERIVLVKEGFVFWAFVFNILWLLAHRCWRMSIIYLALAIVLDRAGAAAGLSNLSIAVLQLGLQFWLGGVARDAYRTALEHRGYREIGVVVAESALLAERRYFDSRLGRELYSPHYSA